jgi:hypothetical protein
LGKAPPRFTGPSRQRTAALRIGDGRVSDDASVRRCTSAQVSDWPEPAPQVGRDLLPVAPLADDRDRHGRCAQGSCSSRERNLALFPELLQPPKPALPVRDMSIGLGRDAFKPRTRLPVRWYRGRLLSLFSMLSSAGGGTRHTELVPEQLILAPTSHGWNGH